MNKQEDLHRPRIGIDLLGADTAPEKLFDAVLNFPNNELHPPKFTVFAKEDTFQLINCPADIDRMSVSEEIKTDENPLTAIRRKKHSSLCIGIDKLKKCELDAFVSAGNTGALLAASTLSLRTIPGIDRPALLTLIPTKLDPVAVLDVGGNVKVTPENLLQFALMGIAYQKTRGIKHPCVALLNIGEEKQKGTPELRKAYEYLDQLNKRAAIAHPTFIGNIEGKGVFHGNIDVLITDGFTGNVFLKTAEGIAGFVLQQMQNLGPIEMLPDLKSIIATLRHRLDYAEYPGAILCGVEGIVVKCHGESNPGAFLSSIKGAHRMVKHFFLEKIKNELSKLS